MVRSAESKDDSVSKADSASKADSQSVASPRQLDADEPLPSELRQALSVIESDKQRALCDKLYRNGQAHIFGENFLQAPPASRRQLGAQLERLDDEYPNGGLFGYLKNAKDLLEKSRRGENPLEGWIPAVPEGQQLKLGTHGYDEAEQLGLKELGSCGFVLVAGGLGERLGYSGIKVALPTELATETCYLQYYIEYILACQAKYGNGKKLPLCIMTSVDTNQRTSDLIRKNHYFGMDYDQIIIVQQGEGVPALTNNDGKIAMDGEAMRVACKPHGHGDVHALLYKHGVAKKWKEDGIKWITLFQDTNGLAFHTLPVMLGVSVKNDFIMNSLAVPRKAKQAIGAICKLKNKKTKEYKTINVEYNQLEPVLKANGFKAGDTNDKKTGYSPYPGNINQLLFQLDGYYEAIRRTRGLMPEFVNPKYKDEAKTEFKKPTRLECMMQDFPTILEGQATQKVGFTSIDAELCFSPCKNATSDGGDLQKAGTAPGTAATAEADQYAAQRIILQHVGVQVAAAPEETYDDVTIIPGPKIVLKPDFVIAPADYKVKFPTPDQVTISPRSTLIVRGRNVVIESLNLDGALVIDVDDSMELTIKDKVVKNEGWQFIKESNAKNEIIKMRGYSLKRKDAEWIEIKPEETNKCNIM